MEMAGLPAVAFPRIVRLADWDEVLGEQCKTKSRTQGLKYAFFVGGGEYLLVLLLLLGRGLTFFFASLASSPGLARSAWLGDPSTSGSCGRPTTCEASRAEVPKHKKKMWGVRFSFFLLGEGVANLPFWICRLSP